MVGKLVAILVSLVAAGFMYAANVSGDDAEAKSRYRMELHDQEGSAYVGFLYAADETQVRETDSWAGAMEGDVLYRGHYRLSVRKAGERNDSAVQSIAFAGDGISEFNASREMVYAVKASGKPDILVVTQYGSSNGVLAKLYYIQDGKVEPIQFTYSEREQSEEKFLSNHLIALPDSTYQTVAYRNDLGRWVNETWLFDQKAAAFVLQKRSEDEVPPTEAAGEQSVVPIPVNLK